MLNKVIINPKYCKACGLCFDVCPKKILQAGSRVNEQGYYYTVQTNASECTACRLCAIMCPDAAINVYKNVEGGV